MRLGVADHHGKAVWLAHRLAERFELSQDVREFDYEVLLVDSDHPQAAPAPDKHNLVKACVERGIPVVLYPHGAMPDLDYDGIRRFAVPISLQLLHGEGHAEIYRRCGLSHPYEVVGWTYGPLLLPPDRGPCVESLLFAPIHPWANGLDILPFHRHVNHLAYQAFLEHPAPRKVVRMWGQDIPNGILERVDGVEYTQSDLGPAHAQIDQADAVISYGTLAYTALSRGKPVAMIYPFPAHHDDSGTMMPKHWDDYADETRYPAGVGDAPLDELFQRDVSEWKTRFVGGELDLDRLEELLTALRPNRAVRRALARAR